MRVSRLDEELDQVRILRTFIGGMLAALSLLGVSPNSLVALPTVVVFPFSLSASDVDKESGARLAVIIATGIANNGGVVVKPAPPGTERKNYLTAARQIGADYYVSGYVTPLGNDVSVVEQVVSTQNGILIASNTAQISTYADAAGQGATLGDEIIRHHNRNLDAFQAPPPPAAATPTPEPTGAAQADLGKLFHRKGKATPTPAPSPATVAAAATTAGTTATPVAVATAAPTSVAVAPPSAVVPAAASVTAGSSLGIIRFGGSATASLRDAARADLATDLAAAKIATVTEDGTTCSSGVTRLTNGTLALTQATTLGQTVYTATVEITVTDCDGKVLLKERYDHDAGQEVTAVERAVADAAAAIARPPRRRR
jgi:hypothetical protein